MVRKWVLIFLSLILLGSEAKAPRNTDCAEGFFSSGGTCQSCNFGCIECANPMSCIRCAGGFLQNKLGLCLYCLNTLDNCAKCGDFPTSFIKNGDFENPDFPLNSVSKTSPDGWHQQVEVSSMTVTGAAVGDQYVILKKGRKLEQTVKGLEVNKKYLLLFYCAGSQSSIVSFSAFDEQFVENYCTTKLSPAKWMAYSHTFTATSTATTITFKNMYNDEVLLDSIVFIEEDTATCEKCIGNFKLNAKGQCECPSLGFFTDEDGNCVRCTDPNCTSCSTSGCEECDSMLNLNENTGLCECPERTYLLSLGVCLPCVDPNCKKCSSAICVKCDSGFINNGGLCECPEGYFDQGEGICNPCSDPNCLKCSDGECFKCDQGFKIEDGQCVSKKKIFYANEYCHTTVYNKCDQCDDGKPTGDGACLQILAWCEFHLNDGLCFVCSEYNSAVEFWREKCVY